MKQSEVRSIVKQMIIAQGGKLYGFNANSLKPLEITGTQFQNAMNYFKYSPQQATFRATYKF
jgi:hypothetical protein